MIHAGMNRREWLGLALGAGPIALTKPPPFTPAIDTHIHLFDTRRPQGVPWPPKDDRVLYRPALPPRYRKVIAGIAVVGQLRWNAAPGLKITSGFWASPRKTPSLLGPSETWTQDKRISATAWNSFTETRCSEAFATGIC